MATYLVTTISNKNTKIEVEFNPSNDGDSGDTASFDLLIGDFIYRGKIIMRDNKAEFDDCMTMDSGGNEFEVDSNLMYQIIDAVSFLDDVHSDWVSGNEDLGRGAAFEEARHDVEWERSR